MAGKGLFVQVGDLPRLTVGEMSSWNTGVPFIVNTGLTVLTSQRGCKRNTPCEKFNRNFLDNCQSSTRTP